MTLCSVTIFQSYIIPTSLRWGLKQNQVDHETLSSVRHLRFHVGFFIHWNFLDPWGPWALVQKVKWFWHFPPKIDSRGERERELSYTNVPPIHPRLKTSPSYMFVADSPQMTLRKAYSRSSKFITMLNYQKKSNLWNTYYSRLFMLDEWEVHL